MKKKGIESEYHPNKKSAEDWKALWDDVKYDKQKRRWFLEINWKRHNDYFSWLDSYLKELEKQKG